MTKEIGHHFGRTDLERVGIFAEMGYMHGKGYTGPVNNVDIRDTKKAQMHTGVPKCKTGLQDCYFDKEFKRIFEKEAYSSLYTIEGNAQKELKKKYPNLKPFLPPPYPKKHASPGDYFGTFGGHVEAFSPSLKPRSKQDKLPPNFKVSPGKKGGPGYPDIGLSKYPEYIRSSPYDGPKLDSAKKEIKVLPFIGLSSPSYFDKNPYLTRTIQSTYKEEFPKLGKQHVPFYPSTKNKTMDGCFSKWPEYKSSPYSVPVDKAAKAKLAAQSGPFRPQPRNKTMYTCSIMNNKVDIAVNSKNWRGFKPITYTREFLV